jgi:hypothetical protein
MPLNLMHDNENIYLPVLDCLTISSQKIEENGSRITGSGMKQPYVWYCRMYSIPHEYTGVF